MQDAYRTIQGVVNPIISCYANQYPKAKEEKGGKKVYPYAVFRFLTGATNNEFSDNYILQIDIWDSKGGDATEIESITDAVFHALNKKAFDMPSLFMRINRDTIFRLALPDPDFNIQRRQLKFIAKIYDKEQ